jgi:hypothetical protein
MRYLEQDGRYYVVIAADSRKAPGTGPRHSINVFVFPMRKVAFCARDEAGIAAAETPQELANAVVFFASAAASSDRSRAESARRHRDRRGQFHVVLAALVSAPWPVQARSAWYIRMDDWPRSAGKNGGLSPESSLRAP